MSGETDLGEMLSRLRATQRPGAFVIATQPPGSPAVPAEHVEASVREDEGLTVVVTQPAADRLGLSYDYVAAWITLDVHSALAAVGLTAAVSAALAERGISCNVLAGYFHDHLLVPHDRAADAIEALARLRSEAGAP